MTVVLPELPGRAGRWNFYRFVTKPGKTICETNRAGSSASSSGFLSEWTALREWAIANGKALPSSYIDDLIAAKAIEYRDEGAEHIVYHYADQDRSIKVTRPGFLILDYLDRWAFSNDLFADDVEIIGTMGEGGRIQIVISQKWIIEDEDAEDVTQDEIDIFFRERLFAPFVFRTDTIAYYNGDLDLVASDAHEGNFLRSRGRLVPIDVALGLPNEEMRICIAEQLGN